MPSEGHWMSLTPFFVALLVYFDARRFQTESPDGYLREVRLRPLSWTFLALLIPYLLPFYLLRRHRLVTATDGAEPAAEEPAPGDEPPEQRRASVEAAGVIIAWAVPDAVIRTATAMAFLYLPTLAIGIGAAGANLTLLAFLACVWLVPNAPRVWRYREALGLERGRYHPALSVLAGVAVGIALVVAEQLIGASVSAPVLGSPMRSAFASASQAGLLLFAISGVLVSPVMEELVYRGYLFRAAEKVWSHTTALMGVSALFWLEHLPERAGEPGSVLLPLAIASVALTLLRAASGSVLASIVAHVVHNAVLILGPIALLYVHQPALFEYTVHPPWTADAEKEALLERVLVENPDHAVSLNNLAWLLASQDRELERALSLVDASLRKAPDDKATLDTRAEILWKLGRRDEAKAIAERLVAKDPRDKRYRERLARFGGDAGRLPDPINTQLGLADRATQERRYVDAGAILFEARNLARERRIPSERQRVEAKIKSFLARVVADPGEEVQPLIRANPDYPAEAERKGIEGWVYLQFTVTKNGRTEDIVVLDADPKGVFDASAIAAVQGYRYRPRAVDGKPVDRKGMQIVLSFDVL